MGVFTRYLSALLIVSLFLCFDTISAGAQTAKVAVPGTKVRLAPPPGFMPLSQMAGFGHNEESGGTIVVTELQLPLSEITGAFTPEQMAKQNMTLVSKGEVTVDGKRALLLNFRQEAGGATYVKWAVVLGTVRETVLVTGACLESWADTLGRALQTAVLTVEWNAAAPTDPTAGVSFAMGDVPGLKLAQRFATGLVFTPDGTLSRAKTSVFMIMSSGEPAPSDPEFPVQLLKTASKKLTGVVVKTQTPVTIAGLTGTEIVAEAVFADTPSEHAVVYFVVLPDADQYYFALGFAPPTEAEKSLDLYRRFIRTFSKK